MGVPSQEFMAQSPTYNKWVPVFGSTVSALKPHSSSGISGNLFLYGSHPITHVEMTGYACAVSRTETPTNKISFVLDDGSGVAISVFWFTEKNVMFRQFQGNTVTVLGCPFDLFGQVIVKAQDVSLCCDKKEVLSKTMATVQVFLGILSYEWTPLFQGPDKWTEELMEQFLQLQFRYCSFDKAFHHEIPKLDAAARIIYPAEGCVALELRGNDDTDEDDDIEEVSESQFKRNCSFESSIELGSPATLVREPTAEDSLELRSKFTPVIETEFIENPNEFIFDLSEKLASTPKMAHENSQASDTEPSDPRQLDNPMAFIADLLSTD